MRAELSGLAASTFLLLSLWKNGSIMEGLVILYNDCAKAHKLINKLGRKFNRFLVDDYDLIIEIHQNIEDLSSHVTALPTSLVDLRNDHILTSKWHTMVQESAQWQTICKRNSWVEDQFDMVGWSALKTCLGWMPRTQQLLYSKLLHGLLNTNIQNCKYYKTPDLWPHCGSA